MSKIKLYVDFLSQPCRALYMFFKLTKIPFETVEVSIAKGEHFEESYKAINPFQKLPSISDNGFNLAESIAIVRYLDREHKIDEHWYPKNSKDRALVDEYLEWQHNNTRMTCALYFQIKWLLPILTRKEPNQKLLDEITMRMETCLDSIENIWLDRGNYIVGNKISVADIFAACEIEQVRIADYNPVIGRPKLEKWFERIKNETNPFYEEAHKNLNILVEKGEKRKLKTKL